VKKKKSEMIHLRKRWNERVGGTMTKSLHDKIVAMIHSKQSTPIRKTSNRVTIHDVLVIGNIHRVAYDKERKQIVTVLPREET